MNRYILYISPTGNRSNWRHFYRTPPSETHFRIPPRYFNLTQAAPIEPIKPPKYQKMGDELSSI